MQVEYPMHAVVGMITIGAAWLVLHFALTINKHATSKLPRIFC
jgi:hypothetical protein